MKRNLTLIGLLLASIAVVSCAAWRNGAAPTKAEQQLFTVTTNYVTEVTPVTTTNVVTGQPQVVQVTNLVPQYNYTPGHVLKDVEGGVSVIPVYGSLASGALGILAGIWGWLRSSKSGTTATTLAQEIEAIRQFIQALPNGNTYDNALVQFLTQHQAETGTIQGILSMLENDVSNPDAKIAAQQIIAAINALNPTALPPGTSVKV